MNEDVTQGLETSAKAKSSVSVNSDAESNCSENSDRDGIRVVCLDCDFEAVWSPEEGRARHLHGLRTDHEVAYESVNDRVRCDGGYEQVMYKVDVYESGADDLGSIVVPEVPVIGDKVRSSDGTIYSVTSRTWLLAATVSYDSVASITVEPVGVDEEVAR